MSSKKTDDLIKQSDLVKSHDHYMDHKHYTDIMHSHGITDPGHGHNLTNFEGTNYQTSTLFASQSNGSKIVISDGGAWQGLGIAHSTTSITVNAIGENERSRLSTESRYINNLNVNRQYTDSNDTNAIENRPNNYTVKIWKRLA